MTPTIGSVWRDNYDAGTGRFRCIRVLAVKGYRVQIQRCAEDGSDVPRSPVTMTDIKRFDGGKSGFTLLAICTQPEAKR